MAEEADKELKNSSAFKSAAYKKLSPAWEITNDLYGSSLAVRLHGEKYLTRFPKEPKDKYKARLKGSVFESKVRSSIETMVGMAFRTDPKPENLRPEIDAMMTDIDLSGNSFWYYCLTSLEKYLRDGNGFIYVDMPVYSPKYGEDGQEIKPTLRDRWSDRPYLVFFTASQAINYRYEKEGSRDVLSQVTIEERVIEADGEFGEKEVLRHRILRRGLAGGGSTVEVRVWDDENKKFITDENGEQATLLSEITLFPIDEMDAEPPLMDLALLNELLYNKTSDFDNICHLVCSPLRIEKYDTKEDMEAVAQIRTASPAIGLSVFGQHANVFFAEVDGAGMQLAQNRYKDVEAQMANIGVGMFAPSNLTQIKTATEVLDSAGARQSKLANYVRRFANAMEKALYAMAEYINAIKANTINLEQAEKEQLLKLKVDYDRLTFDLTQITFFSDLVDSGKLSLETFLTWLAENYDMPADFSARDELQKIARMTSIVTEPETPPEEGLDKDETAE